ncbi:MAG: aldo/keto reductase [Anaerolineaceae bacterium]|nr:aldo/keto reductase [Anaerolineaceae bacterium]
MEFTTLGKTDLRVSMICLGAMRYGARDSKAISFEMLDYYLDCGGNFIDTANIYAHWYEGASGGESETMLGEWFKERGSRGQVVLASKVGFPYQDVESGTSARQIESECEKSLRRMGVETIDLYYAHHDDRGTPLEESLEAFYQLIRKGKVRRIGASNFLAWRIAEANGIARANGWEEYCCVQQRYTYLRPRAATSFGAQVAVNSDLEDFCRAMPVTLLAYSPLLGGAFVRDDREINANYLGADSEARLSTLHFVAKENNWTVNQVILVWLMQHSPRTIPLVSAGNMEQMREDMRAAELRLSAEHLTLLDQAGG